MKIKNASQKINLTCKNDFTRNVNGDESATKWLQAADNARLKIDAYRVRIRLLEEATRTLQAGRAELLVEQGSDEGPRILAVDDGDDEFHARSISAASDRGQRGIRGQRRSSRRSGGVRCGPERPLCRAGVSHVSTDRPSSDPRATLAGAIEFDASKGIDR